ncbi:endonuclease/exonuclease/phosphatase family protein [Flavimaricola marinus]|uniref:endonuclease/exonuclease/phosphatase family protein n=1 Tax=Flavimaricola marinus TaxID=1819565 RepID=UPI001FE4C9DD|nr:endonuclease/exonuclease/phosphatase family protein [Flavimaricola marinus]
MAAFLPSESRAQTLRVATWAAPLSRDGPGLLLRDIRKGEDAQIAAFVAVLDEVRPDVLLLTDIDWDLEAMALTALIATLRAQGLDYPYHYTARPNAGIPTGLDMDGNGRLGEARDGLGYGRFSGNGGLAIISRYPVGIAEARAFTDLRWRDLPDAVLPLSADGTPFPSEEVQAMQPLSSTAHWVVPITVPEALPIDLMVWSATPPVFDGPEDQNGLRGRDELRLWTKLLDGDFGDPPARFVIAGNANLDPVDGNGFTDAMAAFLNDPRVIDPRPRSAGAEAAADPDHRGDPALDTADWDDGAPGNLRVSYVLPSASLRVVGSGVFWPAPDDPKAALLGDDGLAIGPHRLVWVDIDP